MITAALATDVDTSTTTPSPLPLITYDMLRPSLTVRNVSPEWLDGFRVQQRGDRWSLSPRHYGPLLWSLCQQAGAVEVTLRRRRPSQYRAFRAIGRCEGQCIPATTLVCACPACGGRHHGKLSTLVWGLPRYQAVPEVPWLHIEHVTVRKWVPTLDSAARSTTR